MFITLCFISKNLSPFSCPSPNKNKSENISLLSEVLSLWRIRIIAIAVLISDFTIRTMDYDLRLFANCNFSRFNPCLFLCSVGGGNSTVSCTSNCPSSIVWNNMLIFPHIISCDTDGSSNNNRLRLDNTFLPLLPLLRNY